MDRLLYSRVAGLGFIDPIDPAQELSWGWSSDARCRDVVANIVRRFIADQERAPSAEMRRAMLEGGGETVVALVERHLDFYAPHALASLCTPEGVAASVRNRRAAEGSF